MEKGKLTWSKADKAGHESSGEDFVDFLIRQLVSIDDSQFGFVPGRGTTDAVFVVSSFESI